MSNNEQEEGMEDERVAETPQQIVWRLEQECIGLRQARDDAHRFLAENDLWEQFTYWIADEARANKEAETRT